MAQINYFSPIHSLFEYRRVAYPYIQVELNLASFRTDDEEEVKERKEEKTHLQL